MHSTVARIQNVFGFFTTVCFVVASLIAFTDILGPRVPEASVVLKDVQINRGRAAYYSTKSEDYAKIKFSLSADFSSLFNWNTKQIFVYVSATWPSSTNVTDEAVIWDTIITNPSADHLRNIGPAAAKKLKKSAKGKSIDPSRGKIELKNEKAKYQITTPSGKLAETEDVTLKVHYNVQPWVGVLTWTPEADAGRWKKMKGGVSKNFSFPAVKKKEEKKKTAA